MTYARTWKSAALLALIVPLVAMADSVVALTDTTTTVTNTNDKAVALSSFKGKPTVLFYEDRYSTEQNRKVKDELWKRGHEAGMLDAANVVGIANLSAFDFWPAKQFARSHVQTVEKKVGIPVLIDWKGAMQNNPWNLPAKSSTVMVFDADGKLVMMHSGAMTDAQMEELFGKLSTLIGVAPRKSADPHG